MRIVPVNFNSEHKAMLDCRRKYTESKSSHKAGKSQNLSGETLRKI
jgi:hypothetical protein